MKPRLMADVASVAAADAGGQRRRQARRRGPGRKSELVDAFADAAGVPTVVEAVEKSTRRRASQATGWPVTAWLSRFKPDPLKRLHLDLGTGGKELTGARPRRRSRRPPRCSAPGSTPRCGRSPTTWAPSCPQPWADAVRRASVSRLPDLNDALDKAVSSTDLGVSRTPLWWRLVRVLQWLLMLAALVGGLWLLGLAVLGYLQLSVPSAPDSAGLPLPTLLLLGGVALGILLGLVCKAVVGLSARSKARSADRRLRAAIGEVTERLVVEPVEAEVEAYRATRAGLSTALR